MTAPQSELSVDELRETIVDALQLLVDGLEGGYAAPLRRQLHAEGDDYAPAVLCLGFGRIAGNETGTLPCALTLALLEEMGRVFLNLEDGTDLGGWGMPRTLNAADGLYTLGRHALLTDTTLDAESRLQALLILTEAARSFAEALHAHADASDGALARAAESLRPSAAAFAAVSCGLGDAGADALREAAREGSLDAAFVKASASPLR